MNVVLCPAAQDSLNGRKLLGNSEEVQVPWVHVICPVLESS